MKPRIITGSLAILIFVASLATSYYPIYKKGYGLGGDFLLLSEARNYATVGTYKYESSNGVLLTADKAVTEGKETGITNPLTPIIYGQIYKYFGSDNPLMPMYISIILAGLFNVVIFLLITRLFNVTIGLFSAMTMVFMPVRVIGSLFFGSYEFAMIFFAVALWLYFDSKDNFRANSWRIVFASMFFALAALARNAFLISFVPFALYDFYKNRSWKRCLVFVIPFLIIFGSTLTKYSWLGVPNGYVSNIGSQPFSQVGHVYSDPYSLYYNQDNFINNLISQGELNRVSVHFFSQWNYKVGLTDKINAYANSVKYYFTQTGDLTNYGGPIIILVMLLGGFWLYKNNKDMLWFFGLWFVVWLGGLIYFTTGNWDHFLEIIFIAAVLVGVGLYQLVEMFKIIRIKQSVVVLVIMLFVSGHMVYAGKWKLYDAYRSSYFGTALDLVNRGSELKKSGVVAVGAHPTVASAFYYLANRDVVYFSPDTIQELIDNGKLKDAFNIYNVKSSFGYPSNMSNQIKSILKIPVYSYDKTK
jgi:hypothetical protein